MKGDAFDEMSNEYRDNFCEYGRELRKLMRRWKSGSCSDYFINWSEVLE
jgi:hypothetical protein